MIQSQHQNINKSYYFKFALSSYLIAEGHFHSSTFMEKNQDLDQVILHRFSHLNVKPVIADLYAQTQMK